MQICSVNHEIRMAVSLDRGHPEIEQLPGVAGTPKPYLLSGRFTCDFPCLVENAEIVENRRSVGADLQAGPYLRQYACLLQHFDIVATPEQGQCRSKPANPCAGDNEPSLFAHDCLL